MAADFADFGPRPPGRLSGFVYDDLGNDGFKGPGEPGVGGVTVTLTRTSGGPPTVATTTTRADGSYVFDDLDPGTYSLAESRPAGSIDGKVTVGTQGGTAGPGRISEIVVAGGVVGVGNDFGLDRPPAFTSAAPTQVAAGNVYSYVPAASDPDGDPLHYTLLAGPAGATFHSDTGAITWATSAADAGIYAVSLRVDDRRGGSAIQNYPLFVLAGAPNHPPRFTSTPIADAYVGVPYLYHATATDPDFDPLTFGLVTSVSVAGMSMPDPGPTSVAAPDPMAGLVQWTPNDDQVGLQTVELTVSDGRGGSDDQKFQVMVHSAPGNHPPRV
jgi:hypothetical protein